MKKDSVFLLLSFIIMIGLFGCSNSDSKEESGSGTQATAEAETSDSNESEEPDSVSDESVTLPDHFPSDFPLPENITITSVDDEEDEDKYDFGIRFTFDPNLDMDATFEMYDEYAKDLDYSIIIGGEEYFADGIFQFGATSKMSASNMFVVTLKPEGTTFGDIQLKVEK